MAVKEMDYRCWVLDYPAGAGDDGRHFKTADKAREGAYSPHEDQVTARQLDSPCHVVICDTADCGEELENLGEGWTVHLTNPADAGNEAISEGWTEDGGVLTCLYCETADPEPAPEAAARKEGQ